ncbi:MAG: DUF3307 domain-containing protein [Alphaproteobacteria bacterium]|nr:DUF3307 domain-containing protein [Alphaproteobacteria bacterium]
MEGVSTTGVLVLLLLLQVKHWLFDGPMQTKRMVMEKGRYGQPAGLIHSGLQGVGSIACLAIVGAGGIASLALGLADAAVHYHVDYAKQQIVMSRRWSYDDSFFWWAMTFDQMLHQITYIAIAAAVSVWAM